MKEDKGRWLSLLPTGVMVSGGTAFLCQMDLGTVWSPVYKVINLVGIVLLLLGVFSAEKNLRYYKIVEVLIIVNLTAALALTVMVAFLTKGDYPQGYGYIAASLAFVNLLAGGAAVFFLLYKKEGSRNSLAKVFAGSVGVCFLAVAVIVFYGELLGKAGHIVAITAVVISTIAHFAAAFTLLVSPANKEEPTAGKA